MSLFVDIEVTPDMLFNEEHIAHQIARKLKVPERDLGPYTLRKRSIDARKKRVVYRLRYEIFSPEYTEKIPANVVRFPLVETSVKEEEEIAIIGTGPAGLFAALELIQQGKRPILWERGKDVLERRKDLGKLHKDHVVHPDSNYCFGEGGAGTFSDGKLYTRSHKRGNIEQVLQWLVSFGATTDILIDAHPHIGTNKLPKIIAEMRAYILRCGGEIHFGKRLTHIESLQKGIALTDASGAKETFAACVLATGHSAREMYHLFHEESWAIEAKTFALGVRVEHPQPLIDSIQYHCTTARHRNLPAASYALVRQVQGLGVYSFCMCPGGHIVAAATAPGEVVVNGMSTSTRSSRYANSGIVVTVDPDKLPKHYGLDALKGLRFQAAVEQKNWEIGGKSQKAPAQRMTDFVQGRISQTLNQSSYIPGLESVNLKDVLPQFIYGRLKKAFEQYNAIMPGYYTEQANIVGVESRTSAPVSMPRDPKRLVHPDLPFLYPCGEGAGYAGGIVSAALDGIRVARAVSTRNS